ncbi:unnamed protein product, partial [Ectocarpus fasciculatus]
VVYVFCLNFVRSITTVYATVSYRPVKLELGASQGTNGSEASLDYLFLPPCRFQCIALQQTQQRAGVDPLLLLPFSNDKHKYRTIFFGYPTNITRSNISSVHQVQTNRTTTTLVKIRIRLDESNSVIYDRFALPMSILVYTEDIQITLI